jgi:hypothetical protein
MMHVNLISERAKNRITGQRVDVLCRQYGRDGALRILDALPVDVFTPEARRRYVRLLEEERDQVRAREAEAVDLARRTGDAVRRLEER